MKPLRYVCLGAGGIATQHTSKFAEEPNVSVVGFQDVSPKGLQSWKQKFPAAEIDTDPVALLTKTKPDFAIICSPNIAHIDLTKKALAAGCHVLCEKPMAMTLDEALDMEKARRKANKFGFINFSYRYFTAFRFAREIVRLGELGRIQRMNISYLQSFLGAEATHYTWRNDVTLAGFGAMGDLGVHMIDAASYITDEKPLRLVGVAQTLIPTKKDIKGKQQKVTTDTNASFLIQYESGAIGTFETSQVIPGYGNNFHIEISGDRGVLRVCSETGDHISLYAGKSLSFYDTWNIENFPQISIPSGFKNRQPKSTQEVFARLLRGEKIEYPSFDDGILAQRCLNGLLDSMKDKAWANI